jgi:DNA-binding PadR family transcriptional regulator
MHEERRRGPRGEGWGPPWAGRGEPPFRGRAEWPGGPGGPGNPGEPGRGFGRGQRWGGPEAWAWEGTGPIPAPPEFGPVFGHLREFHRRGPGHRRARRGDVRAAILDLLAEGQPRNGYQIIQEIAERTSGVWRPSAGSVYPALQQLEDEGLISPEGEGRRRLYALTGEGRAYAEAHADELRASWGAAAGRIDDDAIELGDLFRQVALAAMEVRRAGTASQLAAARRVLAEARRELYLILANDVTDGGPAGDEGPQAPSSEGIPGEPADEEAE